jgi:endonuclease/exonuclease/phosphatase family metal-dependent hydrolase
MTRTSKDKITPGGRPTPSQVATKHSDSGELGLIRESKSECSGKLPRKTHTYIGTFNIQTLIQAGKLHNLTTELTKQKIQIFAVQETRFTDSETTDYNNYRIFKSGTNKKIGKGAALFGMAFFVDKRVLDSVNEVKPINNRLMTLRIKHTNKNYTFINVHAPTNGDNKKEPEKTERFWEELETEMARIPKDDVKVLLGDFNAQIGRERKYKKTVGDYPAHKFTNKNGVRFVELCQQNNLKILSTSLRKNPKKQKTWRSPIYHLGEFQIDHVAISYDYQKEIHDVQVRRGANIDSDHYLTRIKIKFTPKRKFNRKTPMFPKFDLYRIKDSKITEKWEEQPADNWEKFQTKIIKTAKDLIPLHKQPKHPWWNQECENALEERKKAFLNYNCKRSEETQKKFFEVRKQTSKILRQNKRKYVNDQLESIEDNFKNYNTHDFYKTFANQIKGYSPQNLCFRKQDGKLALTNKENCQELATYFSQLLNCPEPKERFPKIQPENTPENSSPPTQEEINLHIKKLKNNKAAGEDGIVAELLKNLGPNSLKEITQIIQNIWQTEKIPEDWKTALIHPLHKKGDKSNVNNYRGISLLPVTYKILSACLLNRAQKQLEPKLAEYQAGFRPNRSCPEQIFNLKTIFKMRALRQKPLVCTFVDFKKAYDSIDRPALFQILEEKGLDPKTRELIKQTLTGTKSKVKFMGEISEPFDIQTGVRQGDGLSPILFNVVLDKVMEEWEKELKKSGCWKPILLGFPKNNLYIPYLAFADDLAILAEDEETAIKQLEILKECAEKVGLHISFEKTEFLCSKTEIANLKTKYGKINRVPYFKYLGEFIEPTGLEKISQQNRLQKVKKALGLVQNLYNKKFMSRQTKIRHYNTVIKPTFLYASETLTCNRKYELEEIKKEERKIIRKILGARHTQDGYRLQSIKTTEKFSNIEIDIKKRRMKFFGHLTRLPENRLTKRIIDYVTSLKNSTPWMIEIQKDLKNANISLTDILERDTFRHKVDKWEVTSEQPKQKQYRPKWSEERKQAFSERMKAFWNNKRNPKKS